MSEQETAPSVGSVGDIQNYLDDFQKDIAVTKTEVMDTTNDNGAVGLSDAGQYFVDQETGQYYYQSGDGETVTVVQGMPAEGLIPEGEDGLGGVLSAAVEEDHNSLGGSGVVVRAGGAGANSLGQNQVMLNAGDDQYQTVTIVPSDTNPGEVSYVLIVQQPDDKKGEGDISAVYDFDAEDGEGGFDDDMELNDKAKIVKLTPKRSQQVPSNHMCNYCNYTTPKRYLLSRHMKSHSEERPHKCSVCERGFKTLASLQNHVNTHTGTKPHRCKYCEANFTTSGELVRHVRYRHTHEKPHACQDCDYMSVELSKLKRHMRCHTGERPYQCPHCTYASPDTFKLKRHLRIHTGEKPYECDICHARFTQSNSLKAHRTIHTGDKPTYQCELCPTTCGRKTDLRLHVQKLHTSERPMHCKMCGKSFPDRYTLKVHKKTHEGEKCFKCDLCPYSSISQRHLESHMLIHTDQKPYSCDQCDQTFRQKQLLKRHQNLYHNPAYVPPSPREKTHECPECMRSFRHKGNLIRHMALHDPDSTIQQKAEALKIGRTKKIQMIDGQQVEVMTGDGEESDEEDEGELAVQDADGQHYVVLEVIQLPDGAEGGQQVVHVQGSGLHDPGTSIRGGFQGEGVMLPPIMEEVEGDMAMQQSEEELKIKKQQERDTCFGFDDDEDD